MPRRFRIFVLGGLEGVLVEVDPHVKKKEFFAMSKKCISLKFELVH